MRRTSSTVLLVILCAAASCGAPTPLAPTPPVSPTALSTDPKDLVEALLLGSGPLADPSTVTSAVVYGWESGSEIRIRPSTQMTAPALAMVEQFASRIPEATLGHVRAVIDPIADVDPRPLRGEITLWPSATSAGCPPGALLCSLGLATTAPYLHGARIIGIPSGNFPHELGHAVFNFHHTRNPNVFAKETVMAGGFALTDRDVAMMQSLYAAGLGPGATRADLVAAGLINP